MKGIHERTQAWGYFFVAPFILAYGFFSFYPILYTLVLGFTDLKGLSNEFNFVGLANYSRLLKDQYFLGAVQNTFIIWLWNFAPQLLVALLLSIWLSDSQLKLKGRGLFRAVIYMPNLITAASVAMLFRSLFGYGGYSVAPANQFLQSLGIYHEFIRDGNMVREGFNFFRSVPFTRGLVSFIQWWMYYGATVIILMAGITGIPVTLYESAVMDGANSRQITWFITLPLLRPVMLYLLITSMIGGMQIFEIPLLLTDLRGGPNFKIRTTPIYLYNIGFQGANDYAYAAVISMGMFTIMIILALLIFFFMQDRGDIRKTKSRTGGANP
ncbi:MAG: sugar ABC transporter permease [Treponema sp.]|jgi:multiple sugar transport system permease protein|nr:sugar ABC transporter permease [Treponema sp.]